MSNEISLTALNILREAVCEEDRVRLTCPQLDRPLYEEINEVLTRLGGKWKGGRVKAHIFPYAPAALLEAVIQSEKMPPKNPLAFFATPEVVAKEMISLVGDLSGLTLLEPSAGLGAIADAVSGVYPLAKIECVEMDDFRASILTAKGYKVFQGDFLQIEPDTLYDAILMNPPFSIEGDKTADITHVTHAFNFLKPSGRLVAIVSPGFTFRTQSKFAKFKELVEASGGWHEIGAKAFKESGTNVRTVTICKICKSKTQN